MPTVKNSVRIRLVCEQARVSPRTVYRWFDDLTYEQRRVELKNLLTLLKEIKPLLLLSEVAAQLQVHESTVYRWSVVDGSLLYYAFPNKRKHTVIRFCQADINDFAVELEAKR